MLLSQEQKDQIKTLPPEEQSHLLSLLEELEAAQDRSAAGTDFLSFVQRVWPGFISGRHHKIMAEAFDRIVSGDLKRLIINMPPRHTKSEFGSYHLPAYYLGHYPDRKVIQTSNTGDLAVGFGRKVRDLVDDEQYREIFPDTHLKADSKAAGRWSTSAKGEYFAIGVGGTVTGKGADLLIIDDPHSEQEGQQADPAVFDKAYEWYTSGPRQRLQPGAAIVVIMTRWGVRDLTGRILKDAGARNALEEWEVIEFPAILPKDKPLWPEFWPLKELMALREELPTAKWQAQYQQRPTSEEGALVKRGWWKTWDRPQPPECEFIIQTWDTAFLKTVRADYSACTTWGVFYREGDTGKMAANLILLHAYKERLEFPELKKKAHEMWMDRKPDAFIIEGKASGMPLIFELRAMGIPVQDFVPVRGTKLMPNDKTARLNAVSDIFASGMVWAPDTRWADMVIDEVASFPLGEHDDLVDCCVMALMRFRHGGFISIHTDEEEEEVHHGKADYY
jgi:predicted phage terminase large subunit-like protein